MVCFTLNLKGEITVCVCVCWQPLTCAPRENTTVSRCVSAHQAPSPVTATKDSSSTRTRRRAPVSKRHTNIFILTSATETLHVRTYEFSGPLLIRRVSQSDGGKKEMRASCVTVGPRTDDVSFDCTDKNSFISFVEPSGFYKTRQFPQCFQAF